MNKERLNQLIYMLEHHDEIFPDVWFNMELWHLDAYGCKTAACALGSACLYEPFMLQGLMLSGMLPEPTYGGEYSYSAGSKFFGISFSDANYLFDPDRYEDIDPEKITPSHVIARIKTLIERYENEQGTIK